MENLLEEDITGTIGTQKYLCNITWRKGSFFMGKYDIIKNVFETRIISLEDLYIKIVKENEKYYIQLFDENIFEEKVEIGNIEEINLNDINAKLNKSTKVFI